MSSTAAPFGLRPIGRLDSGSLEVFRQYPIASGYGTAIATGDIVHLVDGGTATQSKSSPLLAMIRLKSISLVSSWGVRTQTRTPTKRRSASYIQQALPLLILWRML